MAYDQTKEKAHELIERIAPSQLSAVVGLLETMLDPVSRAIANAPIDDEPESEAERQAVAAPRLGWRSIPARASPSRTCSPSSASPPRNSAVHRTLREKDRHHPASQDGRAPH